MELSRSAHVDTFCRDSLPPQEQWPDFLFELPELRYPERLNCASALLARRQPIGRLIDPAEVAEAVAFCLVNGAVTGQGINVDGGTVQS